MLNSVSVDLYKIQNILQVGAHMKISIITMHYIINYGSVLQTYASQKFFEKYGFEVEIVDYVRENERCFPCIPKYNKNTKKMLYNLYKYLDYIYKKRIWRGFIKKYIILSQYYPSQNLLKNKPPQADIYCTGSDQMWNSDYNGGILEEYFLSYAPVNSPKISFATSIGKSELNTQEKKEFLRYLSQYLAITVREQKAVEELEKLGLKNVSLLLDPTLLLTKEEWSAIIPHYNISYRYVLIYQLNPSEDLLRFAQKLAHENNLKILKVTYWIKEKIFKSYINEKTLYSPSITKFLYLLKNAEYVVTDSFHGTAFAINFNRPFFVFSPPHYGVRIKNILEITQLNGQLIQNSGDKINKNVDFTFSNHILSVKRESAHKFVQELKNYLEYKNNE